MFTEGMSCLSKRSLLLGRAQFIQVHNDDLLINVISCLIYFLCIQLQILEMV